MRKLIFSVVALFVCFCVSSQVINIPDANFKAWLLQSNSSNFIARDLNGFYINIDANNDSEIQVSEALVITELYVFDTNIQSLEGISGFINLQVLNCNGNNLPTLNLSGMSNLKRLECSGSKIETLNLTGLSSLEELSCSSNNFTTLDFSSLNLPNLITLSCLYNESLINLNVRGLTNLKDFSFFGCINLKELHVSGNQFTTLNIPGLPNLTTLECTLNPIKTLDLSGLPNLQNLNCSGNQLHSLNLNNLTNLQSLNCSNNQLKYLLINNGANEGSLNMAGNPGLLFVCADSTQVSTVQALVTSYGYVNCVVGSDCSPSSLDFVIIPDANFNARLLESDTTNPIAKNLNGDYFKIDANNDAVIQLTEALQVGYLDVNFYIASTSLPIHSLEGIMSFANLESLNCSGTGNSIPSLDLSGLSKLKVLICAANGINTLNLNGLSNLEFLSCSYNNFTTLNVSSLVNLQTFYCTSVGLLESLDVRGLTKLKDLQCFYNNNLKELHCSVNLLTTLELTGLPNLITLECTLNPLTTLDVRGLTLLQHLNCSGNQLQTMDANNLIHLQEFNCSNNQLTSLYIKNGVTEGGLVLGGNPGLLYVCADPSQIIDVKTLVNGYGYTNCVVDSSCSTSSSEIVGIPDANFKAKLLSSDSNNQIAQNLSGAFFKIDANNDSEIQQSEAAQVSYLDVKTANIASLEGIVNFSNLLELNCNTNQLTALNISALVNLQRLRCSSNQLTTLDLGGLINLQELHCSNNQLTVLDINVLPNLQKLHCTDNYLTTLDAISLSNLQQLHCSHNNLISLFIKNGISEDLEISDNPNLLFICADEFQFSKIQFAITSNGYSNCILNTNCTLTTLYLIQGNNRIDSTGNGCDVNDIAATNSKFTITNGSSTDTVIANNTGVYSFNFGSGTNTFTPVLENPSYFNVTPSAITVTFPQQSSPFTQDFCYTLNGIHPDLEITLIPITSAVPGFDVKYRIIYKNKGNQTQSGNISLMFDDAILDFVSANPLVTNQIINNLSWNFTNLQPFETKVIVLTLNLNSPTETPAVNGDDILNYIASITSSATDETPNDNIFLNNQTVVNSLDPNDKTCLEGNSIAPSNVGDYVHYVIRFENSGTYPAHNIVVKDLIDLSKFDISTLIPTSSSHSYTTKISDDNRVEFTFENINLPFDDTSNDGYVAFKIKTLPSLKVGSSFSNSASIYFDYNAPIKTNTATTTIRQVLGPQDFEFSNYFTLYPNPVKNLLNIEVKKQIVIASMSIYNSLGQMVLVIPNAQKTTQVDVSGLKTGGYFIKMNSDKGSANSKFIKQ